jgi:hypothetical protein
MVLIPPPAVKPLSPEPKGAPFSCYRCGGEISHVKLPYYLHGFFIGRYESSICKHCGTAVNKEQLDEQIYDTARRIGLHGGLIAQ